MTLFDLARIAARHTTAMAMAMRRALMELGRWLDANAEAVVGDIDSTYVTGDGFSISVDGLDPDSATTVTTRTKRIAIQKSGHGD